MVFATAKTAPPGIRASLSGTSGKYLNYIKHGENYEKPAGSRPFLAKGVSGLADAGKRQLSR